MARTRIPGGAGVVPPGRTGPIGRLARLVLGVVLVLGLASILDEGGVVGFRKPSVAVEASVWFLTVAAAGAFTALVGGLAPVLRRNADRRRWQLAAVLVLATTFGAAAAASHASTGAVWGYPLSDLVWWFDALVLAQAIVAIPIAIVLGTPGCEVGVWPALIALARGKRAETVVGPACVVGIHWIDLWEARRRATTGPRR